MPLLITPSIRQHESLFGYLTRVAEHNGYEDFTWILGLANIRARSNFTESDFAKLAIVTTTPTIKLFDSAHWLSKQGMKRYYFSLYSPKLCPECLKHNSYRHVSWDYSLITCCPDHGCLLVDTCPNCKTSISWKNCGITHCKTCEQSFTALNPKPCKPRMIAFTRQLISHIHIPTKQISYLAKTPPLSLSDIMKLVLFLGSHACFKKTHGTGYWLCSKLTNAEMHQLISVALNVLTCWPENFLALLNQIENTRQDTGLEKRLGSFYETWHKQFRKPQFEFLKEALASYAQNNWQAGFLSNKNKRLSENRLHSSKYMTLAETKKTLKLSYRKILELIDHGQLTAICSDAKSRTLRLITKVSIQGYLEGQKDIITAKEMRSILGIGERRANKLIKGGKIVPLPNRPLNRSRRYVFCRKAISRLAREIQLS
ncbi:TniQ family protein [Kordiimonas laminariae]|uniref:TniQ family protein n=1 Tax=Kordiimonas laminariae TaxID=2917717 RepID=UPI001FF54A83|nr:TniQ family protein [Kordiimonas laminariae]MCK0069416.1 TniQ family protein [Kordiimonas laminariae]